MNAENTQETQQTCGMHTAMITQILEDIKEIKGDIRSMQAEAKEDRKEYYVAIGVLRESITGNGKEGLAVRVDRNTSFRKSVTRLLWILFTPVYGGLIALLLRMMFF